MKNLDEVLHVFDSHTATVLGIIEGEEELYSKEELLEIIAEALVELSEFQTNWLEPVLDELRQRRIDMNSDYAA